MMNWDLYRIFLAVADAGSLLTASKRLKLSAQTVSRRVAELEDGLGLKLLARSRVGHSLTPAGEQLRARIEGMGDVANKVETAMAEAKQTPAGVVRISINEVLSGPWLLAHLSSFYEEFPSLNLEIRVSGWPASVRRREADIVLRLFGPGEENLVGRRIGRVGVAIYCARSYARDHGLPASRAEWETHSSIGMIADIPLMSWFNSVAGTSRRVLQCSSHTDVVAAAKAGLGLAPLLCITADQEPNLVRILPVKLHRAADLWLLSHPDLADAPQVRAVLNFIANCAKRDAAILLGHDPTLELRDSRSGKHGAARKR